MDKREKAYLFGPFFGEVSWEYFRFAPYMIYLKKQEPEKKFIVLTRASRFDFYGKHADVLVPLNIPDEADYKQVAFKLVGIDDRICEDIIEAFISRYSDNLNIVKHFIPDTSYLRFNLKWQFPRSQMDYDFIPRAFNTSIINHFFKKPNMIFLDDDVKVRSAKHNVIKSYDFMEKIETVIDSRRNSYFGCLIELLKKCDYVVSNISSDIGRLALLLKKPLIYVNRKANSDSISILNPYRTPVIDCEKVEDGVKFYENNF